MKHTVIVTPGGERLVLLREADYARLAERDEMAADVAAFDRAQSRLAEGTDEILPPETARRIIEGENLIKVWREHRGLSQAQLAAAADLKTAYVSQIETGRRVGTVETLRRIATALGTRLDAIVD